MRLPPGPPQGRLAQTVMLARDPLGVLQRLRDEYARSSRCARRTARSSWWAYLPFGGGERGCIGRHLAQAEICNAVPAVLRTRRLRPLARRPERLVERATILSPRLGALVVAP